MNVWYERGQQQTAYWCRHIYIRRKTDTRAHAQTQTYRPFRMLYEKLGVVRAGVVVVAAWCWLVGWLVAVVVGYMRLVGWLVGWWQGWWVAVLIFAGKY